MSSGQLQCYLIRINHTKYIVIFKRRKKRTPEKASFRLPYRIADSQATSTRIRLEPHTFYTNQPSVHTKQVNTDTETALLENQSKTAKRSCFVLFCFVFFIIYQWFRLVVISSINKYGVDN